MIIYSGITSSGVKYSIDDSVAASHGSKEEESLIEVQRKTAYDILTQYAAKRTKTTRNVGGKP